MKPFNKILAINLLIALAIGAVSLVGAGAAPRNGDANAFIALGGVILMGIQAVVCWVASLVYLVKKQTSQGLAFLLSGLLLPILGFGTCSLSLFFLQ
ncbi:MAG: hypothetical protein K8R69_08215 [Deltaproteobacteria bacterium]|nr:hypothetical protein [Deltaproteobacteria bacterium]